MKSGKAKILDILDEEGRGMIQTEQGRVPVAFSIPGETWKLGPPPELMVASPDRVVAPCPYFTRCGGCQLQHMELRRQVEEKQKWLHSILRDLVAEEKIRPLIRSARPWNYRRRIQLHAGPKGELGFYAWKSRQVVDIDQCLIADETLNAKLP